MNKVLQLVFLVVVIIVISIFSYCAFFVKNVAQAPIINENSQFQGNHEPGEIFLKTGNLVKGNPGMESGVWYLIYESPGSPAIQIKLQTDNSVCDLGNQPVACEQVLTQGRRVIITGKVESNKVIVEKIHVEVTK